MEAYGDNHEQYHENAFRDGRLSRAASRCILLSHKEKDSEDELRQVETGHGRVDGLHEE